jgi:hypothetical protein
MSRLPFAFTLTFVSVLGCRGTDPSADASASLSLSASPADPFAERAAVGELLSCHADLKITDPAELVRLGLDYPAGDFFEAKFDVTMYPRPLGPSTKAGLLSNIRMRVVHSSPSIVDPDFNAEEVYFDSSEVLTAHDPPIGPVTSPSASEFRIPIRGYEVLGSKSGNLRIDAFPGDAPPIMRNMPSLPLSCTSPDEGWSPGPTHAQAGVSLAIDKAFFDQIPLHDEVTSVTWAEDPQCVGTKAVCTMHRKTFAPLDAPEGGGLVCFYSTRANGDWSSPPDCIASVAADRIVDFDARSLTFQEVTRGAAAKALFDLLPQDEANGPRRFTIHGGQFADHGADLPSSLTITCRPDSADTVCVRDMVKPPRPN